MKKSFTYCISLQVKAVVGKGKNERTKILAECIEFVNDGLFDY